MPNLPCSSVRWRFYVMGWLAEVIAEGKEDVKQRFEAAGDRDDRYCGPAIDTVNRVGRARLLTPVCVLSSVRKQRAERCMGGPDGAYVCAANEEGTEIFVDCRTVAIVLFVWPQGNAGACGPMDGHPVMAGGTYRVSLIVTVEGGLCASVYEALFT